LAFNGAFVKALKTTNINKPKKNNTELISGIPICQLLPTYAVVIIK